MKVMAFNGSPKMEKSNTSLILDPFLDGLKDAGASVELHYTRKLNVNPCQGCRVCTSKSLGECVQKDDMQDMYPKLRQSDVWVFATPVYWCGMSGPLKNLMDRMVPLLQPMTGADNADGRGRVVLVSNCGWWDMAIFDLLVSHMRMFSMGAGRDYAGALLRPHGPALGPMMEAGKQVGDVVEAAKEAGRQLALNGVMAEETLKIVGRELMSRQAFLQAGA
jgi:multimeric flavodoxin WrbA